MNDIISVYRASAAAMRARVGFDGTMLLFKKGDWTAGKDNVDMNGVSTLGLLYRDDNGSVNDVMPSARNPRLICVMR